MSAPVPTLSEAQKWALTSAEDDRWSRKPTGVDRRTIERLEELGFLVSKRERRPGRNVMTTFVKRTATGRRALNLPPLNGANNDPAT